MFEPFFSDVIMHPPNDFTFFYFQVVIIIPTEGQTTVHFVFQVVIMNPLKHPSSWNPPKHSHWWPDDSTFFFRTYLWTRQTTVIFFSGRNYHSYWRSQTTGPFFFSGRNYEPAKTSELVEPPQPFPLTARRLNLFFPEVIMNLPDDCTFFFSGPNYHSYRRPDDCTFFFSGRNCELAETSELVAGP